jgi:hypothetical protein
LSERDAVGGLTAVSVVTSYSSSTPTAVSRDRRRSAGSPCGMAVEAA